MPLVPVSGLEAPPNLVHELLTASQGILRVINAPAPGGPVLSVFGRTGNVVAASGDYSAAQIINDSAFPPPYGFYVREQLLFLDQLVPQWLFYASSPPGAAGTRYFTRNGGTMGISESTNSTFLPRNCTIRGMICGVTLTMITDSLTFTVRINGANTAISDTVTPGQTWKVKQGYTSVLAGDRISCSCTQTGSELGGSTNPQIILF